MIDIANNFHSLYQGNIFTDVTKNVKTDLCFTYLNVIIETLLTRVIHLVFNDSISKCNTTPIILRTEM